MEKPLFWHQGLFLQPQHLQLKDMIDQSLLTPYHSYIKPYLTGVASLSIRSANLPGFSFDLDEGAFWFPDMTYAVIGKNAMIESRNFQSFWNSGKEPMMVYVGLKKYNRSRANTTEVEGLTNLGHVSTRFVVLKNHEEVLDLNHGNNPAQVKQMLYFLKLFFGSEKDTLGDFDLIPVGRIELIKNEIKCSPEYIPPCVTFKADSVLERLVQDIGGKLAARGRDLGEHKRRRGIHNTDFGSRDMVYLLALISLNRYIPLFQQFKEMRHVHPLDIYTLLQQVVGELSSFSEKINVLGEEEYYGSGPESDKAGEDNGSLPPYNHYDLWTCFTQAVKRVEKLIEEITSGPEFSLDLRFTEPYFACTMESEHFKANRRYYLVFKTEADTQQVFDAIDMSIKIGSLGTLPELVERALPGVQLEYLPAPPQELPRLRNAQYWRIDTHGKYWSMIEKEKSLGLYWDTPPQDLKLELMIVENK